MDDRPVIGVAVINGGRQQLDPVAVRIEQVNIVRMAQAVSAGPELDVIAIAQPAGEVAGADDIVNAADDVGVMMQGGSGSTPLVIGAAHVAVAGSGAAIVAGSDRALSFEPPVGHDPTGCTGD